MDSGKAPKPPSNCKLEEKHGELGNRSKKATSVEYYCNDYFSVEILCEILLRLPSKYLIICCAVCKSWHSLVKSSAFIAIHLSRTSLIQSNHKNQNDGFDQLLLINRGHAFYSLYYGDNPNPKPAVQCPVLNAPLVMKLGAPAQMVGSCNGLTCLSWYPGGRTIILNPSVRKYVVLPWPRTTSTVGDKETHYFGYDSRTNDYKVLRIVNNFSRHTRFAVKVYSLAGGYWKILSAAALPACGKLSKSVFVNGTLHWVQLRGKKGQEHINIVSFDLNTELFGEIVMPEALRKRGSNTCLFEIRRVSCLD